MIAVVLLYIVLFILVICLIVSYFIFNLSLNRYSKKTAVFESDINKMDVRKSDNEEENLNWFNTYNKNVSIMSNDNLKLQGYIVKNQSNNYVILVHGYTSNHLEMVNRAKKFYDLGFSVLLLDLRAHGNSEGKYITMGVKDGDDVKLWVKYLTENEHSNYIGLFGISMGAATVMTSLDDMPSQVRFAIEDCGYASLWDEFKYQLGGLFHLPTFPFLYFAQLWSIILAKFDFKSKSAVKSLAKTNVPILMIHGTKDTFVPYTMLEQNYNACNSVKEKFIVEGANHAQAETADYAGYWKTIEDFINKI